MERGRRLLAGGARGQSGVDGGPDPIDGNGATVGADDAGAQAEQVWPNLTAILAAGGGCVASLVSTTTWLVDRPDRDVLTGVHRRWRTDATRIGDKTVSLELLPPRAEAIEQG